MIGNLLNVLSTCLTPLLGKRSFAVGIDVSKQSINEISNFKKSIYVAHSNLINCT